MTAHDFLIRSTDQRLMELLVKSEDGPITVKECKHRLQRTDIAKELVKRGVLKGLTVKGKS